MSGDHSKGSTFNVEKFRNLSFDFSYEHASDSQDGSSTVPMTGSQDLLDDATLYAPNLSWRSITNLRSQTCDISQSPTPKFHFDVPFAKDVESGDSFQALAPVSPGLLSQYLPKMTSKPTESTAPSAVFDDVGVNNGTSMTTQKTQQQKMDGQIAGQDSHNMASEAGHSPKRASGNQADHSHAPETVVDPMNHKSALVNNMTERTNTSPPYQVQTEEVQAMEAHSQYGLEPSGSALDQHRLEATAMLATLLSSKFFENTNTLREHIDLLTDLCTGIHDDDRYIKTVAESIGIVQTLDEASTNALYAGDAALLKLSALRQPPCDNEQQDEFVVTSRENLQLAAPNQGNRVQTDDTSALQLPAEQAVASSPVTNASRRGSLPKTPERHTLKRDRASSTLPSYLDSSYRPDSESTSLGLSRLSLSVPSKFDFGAFPQPESPTPSPRAVRLCIDHDTIGGDIQSKESPETDVSCESRDLAHAEKNRIFSFAEIESKLSIHRTVSSTGSGSVSVSTYRVTRLPIRDRHAELSHPGFRAWTQDSSGALYYEDQPSIRQLLPYTLRSSSLTPRNVLYDALVKPLTKTEMGIAWRKTSSGNWYQMKSHTGCVYIYRHLGEYNMVKIGITQKSVEDRLAGWTEQCNHKTYLAYPCTEAEQQPVPYVYRVEAIIHAELAAVRRQELGCSCGIKHIEWFEEELAHARRVVVKWSEWMRTHPYRLVGPDQYDLLDEQKANLSSLSCPLAKDDRPHSTWTLSPRVSLTPEKARRHRRRPSLPRPTTAPS